MYLPLVISRSALATVSAEIAPDGCINTLRCCFVFSVDIFTPQKSNQVSVLANEALRLLARLTQPFNLVLDHGTEDYTN